MKEKSSLTIEYTRIDRTYAVETWYTTLYKIHSHYISLISYERSHNN